MDGNRQKIYVAAVSALASVTVWTVVIATRSFDSGALERTTKEAPARPPVPLKLWNVSPSTASKPVDNVRSSGISTMELEGIKTQFVEWNTKSNGWISPDLKGFINATLTRVLFTPEMLELLEFVVAKDLKFVQSAIDIDLKKRLKDPAAAEARSKLIGIASSAGWTSVSPKYGLPFVTTWCRYAGEGCSEQEFESLIALVSNPAARLQLEFGGNLRRVKIDPIETVAATLAHLENSRSRFATYGFLPALLKEVQPGSDFQAIEALLPAGDLELKYPRAVLLQKWAESEPASAALHVATNAGRLGPEMMSAVLSIYAGKHPAEALEWVQDWPAGPHTDAAISSVIEQIREGSADTARELAELISNAKIRETALKEIELYNSRE